MASWRDGGTGEVANFSTRSLQNTGSFFAGTTTPTGSSLQVARPAADFFHLLHRRKARPRAPTWPYIYLRASFGLLSARCPCFSPAFPATSLQRLQCPLRNHFPSATTITFHQRHQCGSEAPPTHTPLSPVQILATPYTRDPASTAPPTPYPSSCNQAAPRTERDLFTVVASILSVCFLVVGRKKHTGLSRCRSVVPF